MHALVAIGANLPFEGDPPEKTLLRAIGSLEKEGLLVLAVSRFYATPCFPAGAGPDYVNAALLLKVDANIDPTSVLNNLHRVEAQFGRRRDSRWGMRTLDLDLVALGDSVLPDAQTQDSWRNLTPESQARIAPDQLILPHPRMQDRAFVLAPLADLAPDWRHPRDGRTVAEMLAALPEADRAAVRPL